MEQFDDTRPISGRWMQTLSGLAELFGEFKNSDAASATAVYRHVAGLLPYLEARILHDVEVVQSMLAKLQGLPADNPTVAQAGRLYEDLLDTQRELHAVAVGVDVAMRERGLLSWAGTC